MSRSMDVIAEDSTHIEERGLLLVRSNVHGIIGCFGVTVGRGANQGPGHRLCGSEMCARRRRQDEKTSAMRMTDNSCKD